MPDGIETLSRRPFKITIGPFVALDARFMNKRAHNATFDLLVDLLVVLSASGGTHRQGYQL